MTLSARWTLAKRKMIIQKYGTPCGSAFAHAAQLSDVTADDTDGLPTLEDCTDEYDDTEVSDCSILIFPHPGS
jgi:hypothetical protein